MTRSDPVFQVAWVTDDVAAMEQALALQFGLKYWHRIPDVVTDPEKTFYRGKPVKFAAHVSLSYSGDTQIEIISPGAGDENPYSEFLRAHGPGLHHTAVAVSNLGEALKSYNADGLQTMLRLDVPGAGAFAYVQSPAMGFTMLEVCQFEAAMLDGHAAIKAACK